MRISDWSSDVCSSDLRKRARARFRAPANSASPASSPCPSWPDHPDIGGHGELHPQPGTRDLVHEVGHGPGGLLESHAAEDNVKPVARVSEPIQLPEHLPIHLPPDGNAFPGDAVAQDPYN